MIVICAESSCDLPDEYIKRHNIKILTHHILTFKGDFYDGIEVTGKNVIDYKRKNGEYPVSKCPKVEDYQEEFYAALKEGESVIHITPGIQAYRSFGNASYAAKNIEGVYVTDSSQVSYGYGLVVMEACKLRDEGCDVETILKRLDEYKSRIRTYMVIRDFDCLNNVDKSVAKLKNVLNFFGVYPYYCISDDRYILKGIIIGGQFRLYKGFIKKIMKKIKNSDEAVVITSEYDARRGNEIRDALVRFGGEEFRGFSVKRVSCSEICRYGENMLGAVEILN